MAGQPFDTSLKWILTRSPNLLQQIAGASIEHWLNVELPTVQNLRADLLAETTEQELIQIEIQKENDPHMPHRMAEYFVAIVRRMEYRRHPTQIVLYIGNEPMRMKDLLAAGGMTHRFKIIDIRDLDGEALLRSPHVPEKLLAILTGLKDHKKAVQEIVEAIWTSERQMRSSLTAQLLLLGGLRQLSETVREEVQKMSVTWKDLINENDILGQMFIEREEVALQKGLQKGLQEGRQEGLQAGQLTLVQRLLERRFGPLPPWAEERLRTKSASELEELAFAIPAASRLDDLVK